MEGFGSSDPQDEENLVGQWGQQGGPEAPGREAGGEGGGGLARAYQEECAASGVAPHPGLLAQLGGIPAALLLEYDPWVGPPLGAGAWGGLAS